MRESLLHYVWRTRLFDGKTLLTTTGRPLQILDPGEHNHHAGPDFINARILIDDQLWAGNVEMHIKASEWDAHGHGQDPAYNNVILHVTFVEDRVITLDNGARLLCLELRDRIPAAMLHQYMQLEQSAEAIPCKDAFFKAPSIVRLNWMDRLAAERLESKAALVSETFTATAYHWEETCYRLSARAFGLRINTEPFEMLARSLASNILAKYRNDLFSLEALLFGQAGFLADTFKDEYPQQLQKQYRHLAHKFGLTPLPAGIWKFARLRPANFPSIRLAQFAAMYAQSGRIFSSVLEAATLRDLEHILSAPLSDYWQTHYLFDKRSIHSPRRLGRDFVYLCAVNTFIPLLFCYGKRIENPRFTEKALRWLEAIPAEENVLLQPWQALGLKPKNAFESQALLQLKKEYCDKRRCLDCAIGHLLLRGN